MTEYVLGVDGGNSKTHYALFQIDGRLLNFVEGSSSSHYQFSDTYQGAGREITKNVNMLLKQAGGDYSDIAYSVFGLSGIDTKHQHREMAKYLAEPFKLFNDAFLGIKAGSPKGYGVCSINGTSTCCAAIDKNERMVQIGGPRLIGDEAGAGRIGGQVIKRVYDAFFRNQPSTLMTEMLFECLEIGQADDLVEVILEKVEPKHIKKHTLAKIAFDARPNIKTFSSASSHAE